mgnify:CR=1 FL=1
MTFNEAKIELEKYGLIAVEEFVKYTVLIIYFQININQVVLVIFGKNIQNILCINVEDIFYGRNI